MSLLQPLRTARPLRNALLASVAAVACAGSATEPGTEPLVMQSDRLAGTDQQSCLLERSGEVVCWGLGNGPSRITPGDGSLRFVALRGGVDHLCGLTADSVAYCWGGNTYGQLGDGTRVARDRPTRVSTTLKLLAISASVFSTCALDGRGRAYCWGQNEYGAVGDGTAAEGSFVLRPKAVANGVRFTALDGGWPNCGIGRDQRVYCWGAIPGSYDPGMYRPPGDCTTAYYLWYQGRPCTVPIPLDTELRFATLAADRCALTAQGAAYCWGDGYYGTFGDGRVGVYSVPPVAVSGGLRFTRLTSGAAHVCGLDLTGTAYCWGNNFAGPLGIGEHGSIDGMSLRAEPTPVSTSERFVDLVAGTYHTCALTADERVWCWGANDGQQVSPTVPASKVDVPVLVALPFPR